MPKTAIPGTPEDPLADPFDLWNGKMPSIQSNATVDGDAGSPRIGGTSSLPTIPLGDPTLPPPVPQDPYMPPGLHTGVSYGGTGSTGAIIQPSGQNPIPQPVGPGGNIPDDMPLGDPGMPPPQVGPNTAVPLPLEPGPQTDTTRVPLPVEPGPMTDRRLSDPPMPQGGDRVPGPMIDDPADRGGSLQQPADLDRMLLTYLLSQQGGF